MKLATDPSVACLRRALAVHFDPGRGTPYWLDRERELGLRVIDDVRDPGDLRLLGPFEREALLERPLQDFVPRSVWAARSSLVLSETGATTGRPIRSVFTPAELEEAFGAPFLAVSARRRFPIGAGWLFVGPSGPHVIGQTARLLARLHGSLEPFSVDLDPRWARAQAPGSLGAALYREHVLDQALDILAREHVEVLFTTPPLALALAREMPPERRRAIRGVHLGGMAISGEEYTRICVAFDGAVVLAGYGNSMFGLLVEPADPVADRDGELHLDYFPLPGRLVAEVVRDEGGRVDLDRPVEPGEAGRVVLTRLDRSFFIPNHVERDRAIRIEATAEARSLGLASLGLRDPMPVSAEERERGLY